MESLRAETVIRRRLSLLMAATLLTASGCDPDGRTPLVVRTSLPDAMRAELERGFEAGHPDVDVRFAEGEGEDALIELEAGDGAPFDVWLGAPALLLEEAGRRGLLRPVHGANVADSVAEEDGEALWRPLLVTPFVIAFNHEEVSLTRAPTDWIDVFHFRWTDGIVTLDPDRSDAGGYFVASVVAHAVATEGDEQVGFDWLTRLDRQIGTYVPDSDEALRALRLGTASLAIVPWSVVAAASADGADWLRARVPESGSPVLALGVAVGARTEAAETAERFVDYLGSPELAHVWTTLPGWEPFHETPYPLRIADVAAGRDRWLATWKSEVRGRGD